MSLLQLSNTSFVIGDAASSLSIQFPQINLGAQFVYFDITQTFLQCTSVLEEICQEVYNNCMDHCAERKPQNEYDICAINCHLLIEDCLAQGARANSIQRFALVAAVFEQHSMLSKNIAFTFEL